MNITRDKLYFQNQLCNFFVSFKAALLLLVVLSVSSQAAEWKNSAGLRIGEIYSDNSQLQQSGEDDNFATVITPNINIKGTGARANVSLLAALEYNTFDGEADSFNPRATGHGDIELLEDFFFIDAEISARQTAINPFDASGDSRYNERGNYATSYQYGLSPYITHRLKNIASYEVRYSYDEQTNTGNDLDDSSHEGGSFTLASGSDFGRFSWGLFGNYSKTDFEDKTGSISPLGSSDNEFISSVFQVGYQFTRKWRVTANYGHEWNDFITTGNEDVDGDSWGAGIIWTPTARTNLNLGYGERFFGKTPTVTLSHRHKKSVLTLGYAKSLTDSRSIRQRGDLFSGTDIFNQPTDPFLNDLPDQFSNFTSANNSVVVNEQLDLSYSIKGKRTTVTFNANKSKQEIQDTQQEDNFSRYSVLASRTLSANLSINGRYTWDKRESGLTGDTFTSQFYDVGLTQRLGPKTTLSLSYTFSDRNSDLLADDYSQNRISLFLTFNF